MAAAFSVRRQVFVDEQGYTEEQEFDEAEPLAAHVLAQLVPACATTPGAARQPPFRLILPAKSARRQSPAYTARRSTRRPKATVPMTSPSSAKTISPQ